LIITSVSSVTGLSEPLSCVEVASPLPLKMQGLVSASSRVEISGGSVSTESSLLNFFLTEPFSFVLNFLNSSFFFSYGTACLSLSGSSVRFTASLPLLMFSTSFKSSFLGSSPREFSLSVSTESSIPLKACLMSSSSASAPKMRNVQTITSTNSEA
uniref:Secreted protein n=1 Tax=Haemonchus placei TaxID=6290 RepID=A0A0N4WYV2_HAEPC